VSEIATGIEIDCAGERVLLHPERAMLWPAEQTLFIADLHLGKSEIFRRSGIPIPEGATGADLMRLDRIIDSHAVQRIVLLGDFLHAASPGASTHGEAFSQWRVKHAAVDFVVVAGNHDRRAAGKELAEKVHWELKERRVGPFVCRHDPIRSPHGYVLSGHIHPVVDLYGSHRERARLPVCWLRRDYAVLPSFGSFTGGGDIEPTPEDRLYAFAADRVWRIPGTRNEEK
jgi:DNA ligase-associated metallophosphoesterase